MAYSNTISILIQAKDEASAVLQKTADSIRSTSDKLTQVGQDFTSTGRNLTRDFTLPMVALGTASVKMAMDFDQSMELIRTQAGASQAEVDNLSKAVLNLAPQVGQGPKKLADALFYIESSGIRGARAMDVLKLAAEGASIGQADLADTTNALTSAMNSQIAGAETATSAMGSLNAIVGAGKMHMQDLNDAISSGFLETAKLFGVSLDSVGAGLATLTRVGEPAAQAATRLRMAITLMAAPTNVAAKALAGIGISTDEIKASTEAMTAALASAHVTTNQLARDMQQPDGLNVAITDLRTHLQSAGLKSEEAAAVIARAFGGGRTSGPIMALVQNGQDLNETFQQITRSSGDFSSSWAAQQQQAKQRWNENWAAIQADLIMIGNRLLPTVSRLLGELSRNLSQWTKDWDALSPAAKRVIEYITIALGVGGPVLIGIGAVISALGAVGGAIGLLATPFIALGKMGIQAGATITESIGQNGVMGTLSILKNMIMAPSVMGGIAVAGALADIALVAEAVDKVMGAIAAMNRAQSAANSLGNGIDIKSLQQQAVALRNAGDTSSPKYKGLINAIASYGGGRAAGGPVQAGQAYPVGENPDGSFNRTTELFVPNQSGTIIPANKTKQMLGGKNVTFNQTNHIYNNVDMTAANREIGWRLAHA